jgi:Sporulation protein and related proteins
VGLSQWGARGMAEAGFGYREILGHYFPGTSLSDLLIGQASPPALSARTLALQHRVPKSELWKGFSGAPTAAFAAVGYLALR